ncbi:MAG: hypothetical protein J6T74_04745 [Clostridia bacterium]|nr:hypothetical protein [Clostridia bacterium]
MFKREIQKYTKFREDFDFKYERVIEKDDCKYFKDCIVEDSLKKYSEGNGFINLGYNFKNSLSRALSNLYPITFNFRGKKVNSIEGVLQGIKYKDKKIQNLILKYSGLDAYHTRAANTDDFWGNEGFLYWQGNPIKRDSNEYQLFLDELYLSASKNPIYKRALLATGDWYLLHHIGCEDISQTVLTRYEYELRVNSLREYIKQKN